MKFTIEVGDMPAEKAKEFIEQVKATFKKAGEVFTEAASSVKVYTEDEKKDGDSSNSTE